MEIRCPKCNVRILPADPENIFDLWGCEKCSKGWDTFTTKGKCPKCSHVHTNTQCLECSEFSPHKDFYIEERVDFLVIISILIRLPVLIISLPLFTIFYISKSILETIIMFIVFPIMIIFYTKNEIRSSGLYLDFLQDLRSFFSMDNLQSMYEWSLSSNPYARFVHVNSTNSPIYNFVLNIISWFITVIVFSVYFSYLLSHLFPFQI